MKPVSEEITLLIVDAYKSSFDVLRHQLVTRGVVNRILHLPHLPQAPANIAQEHRRGPCVVLISATINNILGAAFVAQLRSTPSIANTPIYVVVDEADDSTKLVCYNNIVEGFCTADQIASTYSHIINLLNGYWKGVHLLGKQVCTNPLRY